MSIKTLLLTLLFYVFLSCGSETNEYQNNNSNQQWTKENKAHFLKNCKNHIDEPTCICILENMVASEKDVIEIGEMKQNEFMELAKDCVEG